MLILVINTGSSSLKYTLFKGEEELASGLVEKIGERQSRFTRVVARRSRPAVEGPVANHEQAIGLMRDSLVEDGVVPSVQAIEAVGHRVVHGGPRYTDAALVDGEVLKNPIGRELAPLHRANYVGMEACLKMMPHTPQVAVFDTAFHQTMPAKAYTYALPYRYVTDLQIRKYGFHGTSHKYLAQRAAQVLRKPPASLNLITLHLGNGSSLAAVRGGRCVDTSMGLTPLAGVVMGSRCGDIDPAIIPYIMEREGLTPAQVDNLLNKQSGILGLSGVSNDLREVLAQAGKGNARAKLALEVFAYSIQKYVGAFAAVLGRVDALVFTAGIGEKSPPLRQAICQGLAGLGVRLQAAKNRALISREGHIHAPSSKVKVLVIPTREDYMIARETARIVARAGK
ncbi:MAG: acetate kinase [candidate division FCPU426 bacterium]